MTTNILHPKYEGIDVDALRDYGRKLIAAGFRVWLTECFGCGYLTYERGGNYGYLQCSDFEGWHHAMPIKPSRKFGSAMLVGRPGRQSQDDVFTVEAAEQCAQPTNWNAVVGWQGNAGSRTWISANAVELTA